MKLTVIGTGYVGLVTGTCFAELGHHVTCIDNNSTKVDALIAGKIPIYEPGLEEIVLHNQKVGRLDFSTDLSDSVPESEAIFIAVGTPPDGTDGGADLSFVYAVAKQITPHLPQNAVIITKSTVPVGTGDEIERIISELRPDLNFHVVSNPEFLREGCAIKDFLEPDRVVIGTKSDQARSIMARLYKPLTNHGVRVLYTDLRSSELIKYASNAFLATKIAFINEMADICEAYGANIEDIASGMGMDNRIGKNYLMPGPGFGGSCFPKDTLALVKIGKDSSSLPKVVEAVIHSNDDRKINMANKIVGAMGGDVEGKKIAFLGLAFKANTDDVRFSSSLVIVPELINHGANIVAFDPEGMKEFEKEFSHKQLTYANDTYSSMKDADALVIATEWDEFKRLDFSKVRELLKTPNVIDLRNLYPLRIAEEAGVAYHSIGRATVGG